MSRVYKIATRQNGGDPIEVEFGARAANVITEDGEPLLDVVELKLKRSGTKAEPSGNDAVVVTEDTAEQATKRVSLNAIKTWLKTAFDSLYLGTSGDGGDLKPTYTEATARANIYSGLTLKVILGRIQKFFTDLKTVAFSGSYTDLINKPTTMPPTAHASSHATGGADAVTPAAIGAIPASVKGAANGVASLGADGRVPVGQLPPIQSAVFIAGAAAPADIKLLWIDTSNGNILKFHNGSAWVAVKTAWA